MRSGFLFLIFVFAPHSLGATLTALEAVESTSGFGEVHIDIGALALDIKGLCSGKLRTVQIRSARNLEIKVEYFKNGAVREYIIARSGQEIGFLRVERGSFDIDSTYSQPRLSFIDETGRIIGEVANAENQADFFFVRDRQSRIIARAQRSQNGKWQVKSEELTPEVSALFLFASRTERHSCEAVSVRSLKLQGAVFGAVAAAVIAGFYARHRLC